MGAGEVVQWFAEQSARQQPLAAKWVESIEEDDIEVAM
jgi:hypothetical protein